MLYRFSISSESERVTRVWGASLSGCSGQRSGERIEKPRVTRRAFCITQHELAREWRLMISVGALKARGCHGPNSEQGDGY